MRLLITRPHEDAVAIAEVLRARGHVPVIAPLMDGAGSRGTGDSRSRGAGGACDERERRARAFSPHAAPGCAGLCRRTANGGSGAERRVQDGAQRRGRFAWRWSSSWRAHADPAKGQLLHAAGAETAGRLRQALQAKGFTVETTVLYDAVPVAALPENALATLAGRDTRRRAAVFTEERQDFRDTDRPRRSLPPACEKLDAYCISAATAAALTPLTFARVAVAGAPNQDAIIALIPPPAPGP